MLEEHGAVSEPVARAMAEGVARRFGVEGGVAVTGIAGPGGGTEVKPVGTVWMASALNGSVRSQRALFPGTRHEIRARAAQAALLLLYRNLRGQPAEA
jgi:nicotinamide-nucleotide amidase